ncbi:unnamed protein product [Nippostrongylus brasiliensis]|uniref:Integrase catalytic domain-containing protein n=1 Tax=Nippostrongylus brasiliensis TaxID=27835 RepID=A0A0N4XFA7_NIPBR|nr:unnamed protein product [Nippostrongylus brasiliensis]
MSSLAVSKLPQIPIPIFTGKRWDWENFWALFQANVHNQDLTDLQKFNYLLSSLKGEARQSISRFHVSATNYSKAIEHLRKRYGSKDGIIIDLNRSLSTCVARGPTTADQRHLYDRLSALVSQLEEQSENVDSQLTIQTVLHKFHGRIQRAAMEQRLQDDGRDNIDWTLNRWLTTIDTIITKEEILKDMLATTTETRKRSPTREKWKGNGACECCGNMEHKWNFCPKIPSPQARKAFLVDTRRCLNCASRFHQASSCQSGNCRKCGGKHHTAICYKGNLREQGREEKPPTATQRVTQAPKEHKSASHLHQKRSTIKRSSRQPTNFSRQHAVTSETMEQEPPNEENTAVLHVNEGPNKTSSARKKVILLAGSTNVLDSSGSMRSVTVLLDTGSELSFVEESLAQELALPVKGNSSLNISTFGSPTPIPKICGITELTLCDIEGMQHHLQLHMNDFLTSTIEQAELDQDDLQFIQKHGIVLSLPTKQQLLHPQILLGCDYLWNFLLPMSRLILPSGLVLIPTKFGYIISGQQTSNTTCEPRSVFTVLQANSEKDVWDRYWSLESSGTEEYTGSQRTETQLINGTVLQYFKETTQHRDDGYYVRLPWKETRHTLPDNKMLALKRLQKVLEIYDENTLRQYDNIFRDQCEKGVIEEVSLDNVHGEGIIHYLPHQAVITPQKETTKLRIVFDASAHYKNSPCLNDVLHQGPLLLPDLVGMLLRFRTHPIAVISDVEKAFLQVRLQEIDRDATRCFWVRDIELPLSPDNTAIYRFTRVIFGLNTSPFLLSATINFHLDQLGPANEMASEIKQNLYVDNLIYGARTPEEAQNKYIMCKEIFEGLNMNLREFMSNCDEFNSAVKATDLSNNRYPKVLGIPWITNKDKIILRATMKPARKCTKRIVAQQIASVFDPLGLLVPLLLPAKVFLQSLWRDEFSWDQPLPAHLQEQWRLLSGQISTFYKEVDRRIVPGNEGLKLFAFADASQFAIATCVYIATTGNPQLVMAKSKLPSLKTSITIPKQEMNALTLSARVTHFICSAMEPLCSVRFITFFTDSEIVLGWIKNAPSRKDAGTLVINRLKEIRKIVEDMRSKGIECVFRYISTTENPADCGTRGVSSDTSYSHFWWTGPQKIKDSDLLPHDGGVSLPCQPEEDKEQTPTPIVIASLMTKQEKEQDGNTLFCLSRIQSLYKAQKVVAYVMRFIKRAIRSLTEPRKATVLDKIPALRSVSSTRELTGVELKMAKNLIIRDHQAHFATTSRINSLKNLNIRKDEHGLLRCFGRLDYADISIPSRTPVFIAPKTALARLIILEAHGQYHCGIAHTMSIVRERYWIPKLRQQTRSILRKCIPCQKLNGLPYRYPDMDALPKTRVRESHPFEHIGLDYFGPITVTITQGERSKAYGCILTCSTTRLIHLELVEDMTTESFLNALRRFFARRGIPTTITSDNAPTFLLGEKILLDTVKRINEDSTLENTLARREIEWIHITPYAPWQGGFYERLIRSIKHSLYKALGNQVVSLDVLRTMLTEVEAVLNSRPLSYQEEQWDQQPILRPIDFLQRDIILDYPLEYIGGGDATYHTPEEAQQMATQRQVEAALKSSVKLTSNFWKIWSSQYLTGPREHHKVHMDNKRGAGIAPKIGEVVLLCDSSQPRNTWKIGRIVELNCSVPNKAREAIIELPNKSRVRRPVNRLVPLEVQEKKEDDTSKEDSTEIPSQTSSPPTPYTLRKRKAVCYKESDTEDDDGAEDKGSTRKQCYSMNVAKRLPFILTILLYMVATSCALPDSNRTHHLQCTTGGVILSQSSGHPYEICADDYCLSYETPREEEHVQLPPHVTLHDYIVKWRIVDDHETKIMETVCQAAPFCQQVDCTFCVATMANPECWPRTAILLTGLTVYLVVTMCYCFFHVPVVVGKPMLYMLQVTGLAAFVIAKSFLRVLLSMVLRLIRRTQRTRRRRLWSEIAILLTLILTGSKGCQQVDVYGHQIFSCYQTTKGESCHVDTSAVIKINPFKQEACLRLTSNHTTLLELKLLWKFLELTCKSETLLFSRSTSYGLLDSKRCPHAGSCSEQKCGAINRTSQVPELQQANDYPGVTGCVESCGGPGCGCLYLSSGCLFYRIYLIPNDNAVYELFRCTQWKPSVSIEITVTGTHQQEKFRTLHLKPNQPQMFPPLTITLSSLTVPPLPILNSRFISDGNRTAMAPPKFDPPLKCRSWEEAQNMTCVVEENCKCTPAEEKMVCDCDDFNLTAHMLHPTYQLPILRPNLEFSTRDGHLFSRVLHSTTAEFIVRIKDQLRTVSMISDAICSSKAIHVRGCYKCAKGVLVIITCSSSTKEERAEIRCGEQAFTVKCTAQGTRSELRFTSDKAHFVMECSTQCGQAIQNFKIDGTLSYTGSIYTSARRMLNGESEIFSEINLPDFSHLMDVFMRWTGTLLVTVIVVLLALFATYVCVTNAACFFLLRILFRMAGVILRLTLGMLWTIASAPMSHSEDLERRLKRELKRKITIVESSRTRPTEAMIQERLRKYGDACFEAEETIQQARYEYANLLQDKSHVYNRRGGVYHYLVMMKQLHARHTEQKKELISTTLPVGALQVSQRMVRNPCDCR